MPTLANELETAVHDRLRDLSRLLDALRGRLAATEDVSKRALGLFETYHRARVAQMEADETDLSDGAGLAEVYRMYLRDIGERLEELEDWFSAGADAWVTPSLVDAVTAECRSLGSTRNAILAVGEPDNIETLINDLSDLVFQNLHDIISDSEIEIPTDKFAMIRISRMEASNPIWRPLILGHEVAHLVIQDKSTLAELQIEDYLEEEKYKDLSTPPHLIDFEDYPTLAFRSAAGEWLEELICDAYTVRRFGPAAITSLGAYFEQVGATELYGDHPPGWFRLEQMLNWLGETREPFDEVLEPWRELISSDREELDDWAQYLVAVFRQLSVQIQNLVDGWNVAFDCNESADCVRHVADYLADGIPIADIDDHGTLRPVSDADIINAGWIARLSRDRHNLYRILDKALESADFLTSWTRVGGELHGIGSDTEEPESADGPSESTNQAGPPAALLTHDEIERRLLRLDDHRLVVTPLLSRAIRESSIDLRLGRHFVVFQRSSIGVFDALKDEDDPRTMQRALERRWGEPFVLHPGEFGSRSDS